MGNKPESEKEEFETKYRFLNQAVMMTDERLRVAQKKEPDKLVEALEIRDKTIQLILDNGFNWRIRWLKNGLSEYQVLEIWNVELQFGYNHLIQATWFD